MPVRDLDYAPFPLCADELRFGLTSTSVSNEFGSATARSRRTNRSGRATIFLHGAAGSWTTWTPLLQAAEETGIALPNPVLIDLPGWGTGTLTAKGDDDILAAACSLVTECAENLGFTEWDLIGHSMGAFIALHLAATAPEHVLSVGAISATGQSVVDGVTHPVRGLRTVPSFIMLWRIMRVLSPFGAGGLAAVRLLRATRLLRLAVGPLFRYPLRVPASVVEAFAEEVRPRTFVSAVGLLRGYDASAVWGAIDCPVRATQGDHDAFSRAADLDAIGRILPSSHLEFLRDCGHFGAIERPHQTLAALGYAVGP